MRIKRVVVSCGAVLGLAFGGIGCADSSVELDGERIGTVPSVEVQVPGGDRSQAGHGAPKGTTLDSQIFELAKGATLDSVRMELGTPASEALEGGNGDLFYSAWQLKFAEGKLTRSVKDRVRRGPAAGEKEGLDEKVLTMTVGLRSKTIEERLGEPKRYEEVVVDGRVVEEILFYGPWELTIRNGELKHRTKW